jgi:hypothetical protein
MKKDKTWRSDDYLKFIRSRPCCVTGSELMIVAHHVRVYGGGGMGIKVPDYMCVPLDSLQHQMLHSMGEKTFWEKHETNPSHVIKAMISMYMFQRAMYLVVENPDDRKALTDAIGRMAKW